MRWMLIGLLSMLMAVPPQLAAHATDVVPALPSSNTAFSADRVISAAGESASFPLIETVGDTVIVGWIAERPNGSSARVRVSTDRGVTWGAVHDLSKGVDRASELSLLSVAGTITAVWLSADGATSAIQSSHSTNGGATWSTRQTIGSAGAGAPVATVAGETIVIAWSHQGLSMRSSRSPDGGRTWSDESMIASEVVKWAYLPRISATSSSVVVTWQRMLPTGGVSSTLASRSYDQGQTWSSSVELASPHELTIQLTATTNAIHAFWIDASDRLVQRRSVDGGLTWSSARVIARAEGPWFLVEAEGDRIAVSIVVSSESRYLLSADGGGTWTGERAVSPTVGSYAQDLLFADGRVHSVADAREGLAYRVLGDRNVWSLPSLHLSSALPQQAKLSLGDGYIASAWLEFDAEGDRRVHTASALDSVRLSGADRYATAIKVSMRFPSLKRSTGSAVYLATGTDFPDALVAAAAAGHRRGPLLLTPPRSLRADVATELRRLAPRTVYIAGSAGAVSATVEAQVRRALPLANVVRLGGRDRYETGRKIVENVFTRPSVVYLATGRDFADALGATAAAARIGAPVVITDGKAAVLGPDAKRIIGASSVTEVRIVGGPSVVSTGIEQQLRAMKGTSAVVRLAGRDRYQTSMAASASAKPYEPTTYLATGSGFADALGGAALAGATGASLLVVPPQCVLPGVHDLLRGQRHVVVLGGPSVLSDEVLELRTC